MFNLENSITEWRQQMLDAGIKDLRVLEELEIHLREDLSRQIKSGTTVELAFAAAIRRVGQAPALQDEFVKINRVSSSRLWKLLIPAIALGSLSGIAFFHWFIMPHAVSAWSRYAGWLGIEHHTDAGTWIRFASSGMLETACVFAAASGLLALVYARILNHQKLAKLRFRVILANLILAAALTTPNVLTQFFMFLLLQSFYEANVWTAWYLGKEKQYV